MKRRGFLKLGLASAAAPAVFGLPFRNPVAAESLAYATLPGRPGSVPRPIKLSQNENPLGMPPGALEAALAATAAGHLYPQRTAELTAKLAARLGVPPDTILLGNGSSEILQIAAQSVAAPGARAVVAYPTYGDAERYPTAAGMEVVRVPLRADGAHDLDGMRAAAQASRAPTLVFICNPNNPTGTLTPCDALDEWLADAPPHITFLIDEAYFEYVVDEPGYRSYAQRAAVSPNIIVSRTFSKIYGMAGLRLGYGVASGETFRRARAHVATLNTSSVAQAAGIAALDDDDYVRRSIASNAEAWRVATRVLDELGLAHMPTHTNFLMHRISGDVTRYIARMREHDVIVGRPFPPLLEWNRVSLGTPDEMEGWGEAVRAFRRQGWI
jgi:histidinol-phosphate aminotransferase